MTYPTKKLGEICEIVGGGTPSTGISTYWEGDIVWVTPKDLGQLSSGEISDTVKKITPQGMGKSSAKLLPVGSVILSSRAPIGYLAINTVPMATNQGCRSFVCGPDIFNKYLYYFLIKSRDYLQTLGSGSTFLEVSGSRLKEIEIPMPSVGEQRKIVVRIEKQFTKIDEAARLRAESQEAVAALLPAFLHEIISTTEAKEWGEKSLGDIALGVKSGFACGKYNEVSDGVVHLRTHNVDLSGELNLDKIVRIPAKFVDTEVFNLRKGDVVFNNTNSAELVGKSIIIREDLPYAFSNHLTRIRPRTDAVLSEWLLQTLHLYWRDKVFEKMCKKWIGQAGINQTALKQIKIPLPPLAEQKEIVKKLDALSEKVRVLQALQSQQAADLKALKQSILYEAFSCTM